MTTTENVGSHPGVDDLEPWERRITTAARYDGPDDAESVWWILREFRAAERAAYSKELIALRTQLTNVRAAAAKAGVTIDL
ncbi:hypothetical protein AB0H71_13795 [Nocardia sp. NPDC050697]|uniref:hypothetical protein n=1 Tax=Nocardia sp. NPDC050697 TaxID=3155158 RepID=UPI0033D0F591